MSLEFCIHADPKCKVVEVDGTFKSLVEGNSDLSSTMELSLVLFFYCRVSKLSGLNQHHLFAIWTGQEESPTLLLVASAWTAQLGMEY